MVKVPVLCTVQWGTTVALPWAAVPAVHDFVLIQKSPGDGLLKFTQQFWLSASVFVFANVLLTCTLLVPTTVPPMLHAGGSFTPWTAALSLAVSFPSPTSTVAVNAAMSSTVHVAVVSVPVVQPDHE